MVTYKYTDEMLAGAVAQSTSIAGVLRFLGIVQAGGNHAHISRRIKRLNLDISHFSGAAWSVGLTKKFFDPSHSYVERYCVILPNGSSRIARKYLQKALVESGRKYLCEGEGCPNPEPMWAGKPLPLDIDHTDGNFLNNVLTNLRYLCPNCHRQTPTHSLGLRGITVYYCDCGNIKKKQSKHCAQCVKNKQFK